MNMRGLLGAFQTQPDQFQSLLGEYYDPRQAKMKWLGGTLQGLGMGLASGQPGAWATGLTQGGGQAVDDYRKQAMLGYQAGQQAEDKAYGREQDAKNWEYRAAQDAESKRRWEAEQARLLQAQKDQAAYQNLVRQNTLRGWRESDALKQGQTNAVNAWTKNFTSQGGDLFSPEMQTGLRAQGVQGVDPMDTVKFRQAQPLIGAGAVGPAFDVLSTPTPPAKAPQVYELYDEKTGQPYKAKWDDRSSSFIRVGGAKAPSSGITTTLPDGTVINMGGTGKPLTEGQSKDTVYATRAEGALPYVDAGENVLTSIYEVAKSKMPVVGNYLTDEAFQVADSAGNEFLQALLRKDTGATIQPFELQEYGSVYLPQPGDKEKTLEYKRAARKRALAAIKAGMPPQAIIAQEKALASGQQASDPTAKGDRAQASTGAAQGIPPEAIAELRADPSPQTMQEFDSVFGVGAAARILRGK